MKLRVLTVFLFLSGTAEVSAQATATPVPTPSLSCCLLAGAWTSPTLSSAAGVAVDQSRKRIYATDGISGKIFALNYDGSPVTSFGGGFVSLAAVFDVTVGKGPYDGVYAVSRNGSVAAAVTKFDANGNVVWTAPGSWSPGTERTLCVDDWGNVYVADDSKIYVFNSNGIAKPSITGSGSLGPLSNPTGLWMAGLNLYVSDTSNNRVVRFVETGVNTYAYAEDKAFTLSLFPGAQPYGIAEDLTGHFYIASGNGYAVFDENFKELTQWCYLSPLSGAFGIGVDETGAIYVVGSASKTVTKMEACFSQSLPAYHGFNPPDSGECFIYP